VKSLLHRFLISAREFPPERTALVLALGLVIGVFPVMGCPTAMCLVAAFVLRINPAPLLLLNHACSPLQLVLLLPLARTGMWMCGAETASAHPALLLAHAILSAVAGWAVVCIPMGLGLYFALRAILRNRSQIGLICLEQPAR
jgi:uncharacterized protein (DUF2062 family)